MAGSSTSTRPVSGSSRTATPRRWRRSSRAGVPSGSATTAPGARAARPIFAGSVAVDTLGMDQRAGTAGTNRRIAATLFVALNALLVLPCLVVVQPWQRYGVPVTVALLVVGVGLIGLFSALLYRSAENRPDWNHARVATTPTAHGTAVVTVTCTDLIPRG